MKSSLSSFVLDSSFRLHCRKGGGVVAQQWRLWALLLLFFAYIPCIARAFITPVKNNHQIVGLSGHGAHSGPGKKDGSRHITPRNNQKRRWRQKDNSGQQSTNPRRTLTSSFRKKSVALVDKDFDSDDPIEKHFLPLVKKICECQNAKVAGLGPSILRKLRIFKPVGPRWVIDAMKCWQQHPDSLEMAQNIEELLQTMLDLCDEHPSLEPDRYSFAFVVGSWVHHARVTKSIQSMKRAEKNLRDMWTRCDEHGLHRRPHPGIIMYGNVFLGWLNCPGDRSSASQAYQRALSLIGEMRALYQKGFTEYRPNQSFQKPLDHVLFHKRDLRADDLQVLETIMREIEKPHDNDKPQSISPELSASIRRSFVFAYMKNKQLDAGDTMVRVKRLLDEWCEIWNDDPSLKCRPDTETFTTFVSAAKQNQNKDAFLCAEALLHHMWDCHRRTGKEYIRPRRNTYNSVMNVLSSSKTKNAGEKAEKLLQEMWDLYNNDKVGNQSIKPNVVTYSHVIQCWAKSNDKRSGDRVEKLLREMWDHYNGGDEDLKPSNIHFNQAIATMSNVGDDNAADRAESLLREMWTRYRETGDISIKPDHITYGSLMTALSSSMMESAGRRADELLQEMWDLYNNDKVGNKSIKPNAIVYGSAIQCWVKSKDKGASDRAMKLLGEMRKWYNNGDKDMKPTNVEFNQAISATRNLIHGDDGVTRAETLLNLMWTFYRQGGDKSVKPDQITYSLVISVLSDSALKDAAERAQKLLQQMWHLYNDDKIKNRSLKPNAVVYSSVIQCWVKSNDQGADDAIKQLIDEMWDQYRDGDEDLKPSKIHYNQAISAMKTAREGQGAVTRATSLLKAMWARYHAKNDELAKPDRITYASVIDVLAKSDIKGAGEPAESLLEEMWDIYEQDPVKNKDIKPNGIVYSSLIQVWSNSKDQDACSRARDVLGEMWDRYHNGEKDLKPCTIHYNQVISAMRKDCNIEQAEFLLREMWGCHHETGDEKIKPDRITYGSIMDIMANSENAMNTGDRAQGLLQEMWDIYNDDPVKNQSIKPDTTTYSFVTQCQEKNNSSPPKVQTALNTGLS